MLLQHELADAPVPAELAHKVPHPQVHGRDVVLQRPPRRPHKAAELALPRLVHGLDVCLQGGLVARLVVALVTCVRLARFRVGLLHVLFDGFQFPGLKVAILTPEVNLK